MNLDAQCVSWNDISSNNSNGTNSAAASRSDRFNSPSLGGLSGFSFSRSQSNAEGISLGPSPSGGCGVSDEHDHGGHEHGMQMHDSDKWYIEDDAGLSYA